MTLRRIIITATAALTAALALSPAAHAGLLVTSAPACTGGTSTQVFARWADPSWYVLGPDGGFETGAKGWKRSSGATVVSGNEPFMLHAPTDTRSLALAGGAVATSPAICVGLDQPTIRFVARRTSGTALSTLTVSAQTETSLGLVITLPIGVVVGSGSWEPSSPMALVTNLLPLLPGAHTPIRLVFSAEGGAWQIDDVYVDPRKAA
jgi:hypothetical protein